MPPVLRHRADIPNNSRKHTKKIARENNSHHSNLDNSTKISAVVPGIDFAFKAFLSARFCSAIWSYITDCDETFNYWEPLHYMIYGYGLQTWEYSPQYALRSYTYLMIQGVPAWIYKAIFQPSPVLLFYFVRCLLGLGCAMVECYLYKAICREFGVHIGRLWLIFQLFSVGMFISSTALLPSSFSMYFSGAALAAWWHQRYKLAVFFVAISSLLGWPFAALLGLSIAFDMIFFQKMLKTFTLWTAISGVTILVPMMVIDSSYFGKITIAPLNIILYNVFSNKGPNLYGTEPLSYYFMNGFLNFNIVWVFALMTPIMLILDNIFVPAKSRSTLKFSHCLSLSPLFLWLVVFLLQPHKEERFLFPIYPLISLSGAITVDVIQKLAFRIKDIFWKSYEGCHYLDYTMFIAVFVMLLSASFGMSRIFAMYRNFHAPMDLFMELQEFKNSPQFRNDQIYNVCVGKDWYRFPTSFFLPPKNFRVRFLKSKFTGILPAYYANGENASAIVHHYFNDMNQEHEFMYFDYQKCHFLFDLDTGKSDEAEPNYSLRVKEWTIIKSVPFLISERSHKYFRAFYIPLLSDKFLSYGSFNLLRRKKFPFIDK